MGQEKRGLPQELLEDVRGVRPWIESSMVQAMFGPPAGPHRMATAGPWIFTAVGKTLLMAEHVFCIATATLFQN